MKRSGVVRVWDRKRPGFGKRSRRPSNDTSSSNDTAGKNPPPEIPHVIINGVPYYSDRFYLNKTHSDKQQENSSHHAPSSSSSSTAVPNTNKCTCGARRPPPLFDRSALVASLDLKASVLGTLNLTSKAQLVREFPSLFGPDATVPTLVLHDRIHKKQGKAKSSNDDDDDDDESCSSSRGQEEESSSSCQEADNNDDLSIGTQPETTVETAASFQFNDDLLPPPSSSHRQKSEMGFSSHAQFTQVSPTWLPPPVLADVVLQRKVTRQRKRGVYHPKFMLLVEKSGDLVIVVSTANLNGSGTTDGSWVQRFPTSASAAAAAVANGQSSSSAAVVVENDFGAVLHDFITKQSQACDKGAMTPRQFWKKHCPTQSLQDGWDYSNAQADLIPHVPGDFPVDDETILDSQEENVETKDTQRFLYGRQRVRYLLKKRTATLPRLSSEDRLLLQPTSFGADWDPPSLTRVLQSYLPAKKVDHEENLLSRLDIVWPTDDWIKELTTKPASPQSVAALPEKDEESTIVEFSREQQGCIFLSSQSFNKIHTDCLARMVQFQPTTQKEPPLVPHFKSVARLLHRRPPGVSEGFAWVLLTSACLSRGAQGAETVGQKSQEKVVSFSNFELGVLFCSQRALPMSDESLIYCFQPTQCSCQRPATRHRLIHLPLPYQCRASRYVDAPYDGEDDDDEEVLHFSVTPYFHEILPGSATEKNMLLTPFGKAALLHQD